MGNVPRRRQKKPNWTDDHDYTVWNGGYFPCPAGWIFDGAEDLIWVWHRYPGLGEGQGDDYDILDNYGEEMYNDKREETAWLVGDIIEYDRNSQTVDYTLEIGTDTIFRRVEPDFDELISTTAEALVRFSNGQDIGGLELSTGRVPTDIKQAQKLEQRKQSNQSLGDFA